MLLFILDSLGTQELLLILAVALIFFGPRKLPQISRQIGKSLAEFRKASEDFKRTWEREVALETEAETSRTIAPRDESVTAATIEHTQPNQYASIEDGSPAPPQDAVESASISKVYEANQAEPTRKRDWL